MKTTYPGGNVLIIETCLLPWNTGPSQLQELERKYLEFAMAFKSLRVNGKNGLLALFPVDRMPREGGVFVRIYAEDLPLSTDGMLGKEAQLLCWQVTRVIQSVFKDTGVMCIVTAGRGDFISTAG